MKTRKTTENRAPLSAAARQELARLMAELEFSADHADRRAGSMFVIYAHPWPSMTETFEAVVVISSPADPPWDLGGLPVGLRSGGQEHFAVTDRNGEAYFAGLPLGMFRPFLSDHVEPEYAQAEGLTPRLRRGVEPFMQKMAEVVPLMLETVDLGADSAEPFLAYLRDPTVVSALRGAEHVRDELGKVLAEFCQIRELSPSVPPGKIITPNVLDNILWQVAVRFVRIKTRLPEEARCLNETIRGLQRRLGELCEGTTAGDAADEPVEPAGRTVRFVMAQHSSAGSLLWPRVEREQSLLAV
jgi:hypothetical protein